MGAAPDDDGRPGRCAARGAAAGSRSTSRRRARSAERRHRAPHRVGHDDDEQGQWIDTLNGPGVPNSGVIDRHYFHSIYFREPGGVLFELATEEPGLHGRRPRRGARTADHPAAVARVPARRGRAPADPAARPPGRLAVAADESDADVVTVTGRPSDESRVPATRTDLGFEHVIVPGARATTLLLLHSTGGDEHQFVGLGRALAPAATLLSPRGKVLENGLHGGSSPGAARSSSTSPTC